MDWSEPKKGRSADVKKSGEPSGGESGSSVRVLRRAGRRGGDNRVAARRPLDIVDLSSSKRGTAIDSDDQVQKPRLCRDCEGTLRIKDGKYVCCVIGCSQIGMEQGRT